MAKPPKVQVGWFFRSDRSCYVLKWRDPVTKQQRTESTGLKKETTRNDRKAAELAVMKSEELSAKWSAPAGATWEEFRRLYKARKLCKTSVGNQRKFENAASIFEEVAGERVFGILSLEDINPRLLLEVDAEFEKRLGVGSVRSYSATLRAALNWAASMGLIDLLPPRPRQHVEHELPAMRLVPISKEALERMESAAAKVAGKRHAQGIREYLRCLWLSGCRLMEPLDMHAFRRDKHHPIVLKGRRPIFGWVNSQKNRRDQMAPITLEFAAFLRQLVDDRDFLFHPTCEHGRIEVDSKLSDLISEIGKKAKVIAEPGDPPKFATAKHFRSSFVTRWSRRGMRIEDIQARVRHASKSTTERYYLAPEREEDIATFDETDWIEDEHATELVK